MDLNMGENVELDIDTDAYTDMETHTDMDLDV
jgi:hypothetical protein